MIIFFKQKSKMQNRKKKNIKVRNKKIKSIIKNN